MPKGQKRQFPCSPQGLEKHLPFTFVLLVNTFERRNSRPPPPPGRLPAGMEYGLCFLSPPPEAMETEGQVWQMPSKQGIFC